MTRLERKNDIDLDSKLTFGFFVPTIVIFLHALSKTKKYVTPLANFCISVNTQYKINNIISKREI